MRADDLIQFGAVELADLIRRRQVDPIEVVDAHISQIESVNPRINALITSSFDEARQEAARIRRMANSKGADFPPLLGVPVTIKDSLPVAGMRFTAGSTFYRDQIATHDAEAVRRKVEGVAAALAVLSDTPVTDYRSIDLSGRRFFVPKFLALPPVKRDVAATVEKASAALRDVGMVEQHVSLPLAKVSLESTGILCREWLPGFRVALGGGVRINLLRGTGRSLSACATGYPAHV